ncbi:MAG: SdrD B-like domain-containing protein [Planctomycetota bacterium]
MSSRLLSLSGLVVLLAFGCNQGVPNPKPAESKTASTTSTAPSTSSATTKPTTAPVATTTLGTVMPTAQVGNVGDPSGPEQEMVELANRARRDPIAEGNRYGLNLVGTPPAPPLATNALLAKAALAHAKDQAVNKYYDHQNPNGGPDIEQQVKNAGYAANGNSQNIDIGPVGLVDAKEEHKRFFVDEGVNPPGHRWNILSYSPPGTQPLILREMGTSYIDGQMVAVGAVWDQYIVQNFGSTETDKPFVCGVVFTDANNTGEYDAGEGAKDVVVKLRATDGTAIAMTTRTAGAYAFEVLAPGDYVVEMVGGPFVRPVSLKVRVDAVNVKVDGVAGKGLVAR